VMKSRRDRHREWLTSDRASSFAIVARSVALATVPIALVACVASSEPEPAGGENALFDAGPAPASTTITAQGCAPDGGATWSDLYRDCFGPSEAACGGSVGCHSAVTDQGYVASGFVCGTTQDSCWMGMTAMGSIVPAGGSSTPTTTALYDNLRKAPPNVGGTMPNSSNFAFTQADLDRISTWIANGAKND
jgi:hypothetical protein